MEIQRRADDPAVWRLRLTPTAGQSQIVLSADGLEALQTAVDEAAHTPSCRVLVLEGMSGAFCEGMDLNWVTSCPPAQIPQGLHAYAHFLCSLRTAPQAVLVLVDGRVRAGGVGIAAAADVLIATERSEFGLPEATLGLLPAMVLPLLRRRISAQRAQRWAMMSLTLDAQTALSWGLLDQLVPDANALEKAARYTLRQLLRMNPQAVAASKSFVHDIDAMPLEEAVFYGAKTTGDLLQTPERIDQIKMFLQGESLPWFNRYHPPKAAP